MNYFLHVLVFSFFLSCATNQTFESHRRIGSVNFVDQSCLQGFELGGVVIDSNKYIGKVTGCDEDKILYKKEGNSYSSEAIASKLSKEVANSNLKGKTVLDKRNYLGVIKLVFENNQVKYKRESNTYNSHANLSDLSLELPNSALKGKTVIDSRNYLGVINHIFANNQVKYKREGNTYNSTENMSKLSIELPNSPLKGRAVIDSRNYIGVIKQIFENNQVKYRREGNTYDSNATMSELSLEVTNSTVKGKTVIDSRNYVGVVEHVYQNNQVKYKREGNTYSSNATIQDLSLENTNSSLKNKKVVESKKYIGVVKQVFKNGQVKYRRINNSYDSNAKESDLSKEVDTHPNYKKAQVYASDYSVGLVTSFFENGMIQFDTRLVDKLYEKVDKIADLVVGDKVIDTYEDSGEISEIFENGVVVYKAMKLKDKFDPKKGKKEIELVARLYGYNLKSKDSEKEVWLGSVMKVLSDRGSHYGFFLGQGNIVVKEADRLSALKEIYIHFLKIKKTKLNLLSKKYLKKIDKYFKLKLTGSENGKLDVTIDKDKIPVSLNDMSFKNQVEEALNTDDEEVEFVASNLAEIVITVLFDTQKEFCSINAKRSLGLGATTTANSQFSSKRKNCEKELKKVLKDELLRFK